MSHRIARILAAVVVALAMGTAVVSTVALAQEVIPIAEALETMKISDYFTVEGTIVDSSNQFLYIIEDDSGRMPIMIKEHMVREQGEVKNGDRLRIWGRFEHKKLDEDMQGMIVSRLYRVPDKVGALGSNNPGADAATEIVPIERKAVPAAPSTGTPDVIKPMATEDFKLRARAAMQEYRQAEKDALDAGQAYARAARESGSDGQVEAETLERLQAAEAKVVDMRSQIHAIVSEARESGIDEGLVQMIEQEAGLRHP